MSLSVVMPVYNEEDIIEFVVRSVYNNILSKVEDGEFVIVNDCSTDNTLSILQRLSEEINNIRIITPAKNSGHGKAILLGFANAKKDWVFHMDSDNQFDSKEYWELEKFKGNYDFILGFRKKRHDPLYRKALSSIVRLTNLLLFATFIKDSNSSFKLMNNKALQHILTMVPQDSMTPTIMMSLLAKKLKYRIKTVGVTHFPRKTGAPIKGRKLVKVCFRGAKDMLNFRIKMLRLPKEAFEKAEEIRRTSIY